MPPLRRRTFLSSLAATVGAPAILRAPASAKRLPIAFSTLGCPRVELEGGPREPPTGSATPGSSCAASRARWT